MSKTLIFGEMSVRRLWKYYNSRCDYRKHVPGTEHTRENDKDGQLPLPRLLRSSRTSTRLADWFIDCGDS